MKTTGVSGIPKFGLLDFLGHPSQDIKLRYVSLANLVPPNSHTKEPWEWQCWKSLALIALDEDFDRDCVSYWKVL